MHDAPGDGVPAQLPASCPPASKSALRSVLLPCCPPSQIGGLQGVAQFLAKFSGSVSGALADVVSPASMVRALLLPLRAPCAALLAQLQRVPDPNRPCLLSLSHHPNTHAGHPGRRPHRRQQAHVRSQRGCGGRGGHRRLRVLGGVCQGERLRMRERCLDRPGCFSMCSRAALQAPGAQPTVRPAAPPHSSQPTLPPHCRSSTAWPRASARPPPKL